MILFKLERTNASDAAPIETTRITFDDGLREECAKGAREAVEALRKVETNNLQFHALRFAWREHPAKSLVVSTSIDMTQDMDIAVSVDPEPWR